MGRVGRRKQHKLSRFKMREGGFMGQKHQNLDHSALDSWDFSRFLRLMILPAAVWSSWCEVNTGPRTTHAKLRGQWGWWSGFRICFGEESSSVLQHPYNYIISTNLYPHDIRYLTGSVAEFHQLHLGIPMDLTSFGEGASRSPRPSL